MSKDIEEKRLKKDKKEKKEKKEKRAETDGVSKSKKDKKDKKSKGDVEMVDALEAELEKEPEVSMVNVVNSDDEPRGALVPFAFPLADQDKEVKKILKTVKKCTFFAHISTSVTRSQGRKTRKKTKLTLSSSRQVQDSPPRCQGSRKSAAQIRRCRRWLLPLGPLGHCRHRR